LTFGQPSSAGVPPETTQHTIVLDYNDENAVIRAFEMAGRDIAAVIVEPIAGNMNLVSPRPGFLEALREACTRCGAMLIFDEVMTGFRVGSTGAQGLYGIRPDLTTLGKIIGGGLPMGAFGGRRDVMQSLAPVGAVYQAGTLSGNPVAVAAGLATLELTRAPGFYEKLSAVTRLLCERLTAAAHENGIVFCAQNVGGMFGLYFRDTPPQSFADVMQCNTGAFGDFFRAMLEEGIYLAPSAYEAGFVSSAHGTAEIEKTTAAASRSFARLKQGA
jgi:glutamate-1-semialdehyde 2,1-aminomutase